MERGAPRSMAGSASSFPERTKSLSRTSCTTRVPDNHGGGPQRLEARLPWVGGRLHTGSHAQQHADVMLATVIDDWNRRGIHVHPVELGAGDASRQVVGAPAITGAESN